MPKVRRYDARLSVIVPKPLVNAVAAAARENLTSVKAWVRHACLDLLAHVYGWFTEGFDTLDLKEAKASLDELHALTTNFETAS